MQIQSGDICKYHGNFNGKEYTRKIIVLKKDESKGRKNKEIFICFTLTDPRDIHPQVIGKHKHFWTTADKLSQVK